ncbi:hypothetical protein L596_025757 [Steinernema carpocapsae]|uniref:Uncharacterized protein n=1 Tax=Steinernema carpocapsae TaxID=34508 RepID=A0A4U5M8Q4_STECR|nr:hypothetical protein L596_025757 [Steinernema carpocapsae]
MDVQSGAKLNLLRSELRFCAPALFCTMITKTSASRAKAIITTLVLWLKEKPTLIWWTTASAALEAILTKAGLWRSAGRRFLGVCSCATVLVWALPPKPTPTTAMLRTTNVTAMYQEFRGFIDCYEYGTAEKGLPYQNRTLTSNKQSIRCYVEIHEDDRQDLIVEAGLFTTSKAIEAFKEDHFFPGYHELNCKHSNGSTLCHCIGNKCNKASFRSEVVRRHIDHGLLTKAEWLKSRTRRCTVDGVEIQCRTDRNIFNPEPIGCFMERDHRGIRRQMRHEFGSRSEGDQQ